jgi:hypothetical protein
MLALFSFVVSHPNQLNQKSALSQSSKTNSVKMDSPNNFFLELYKNFDDRKIDMVISQMTQDVKWANGMEGGYVYGHNGVREYWTRQFTMVSSNVTPMKISEENGIVKVEVHQVVHDLNGKLLADETVYHFFHMRKNKIAEFDIGEKTDN